MKEINKKLFPTVWGDLFMTVDGIAKINEEPTLQIKDIADWIEEYGNLKESPSGNLLDDLQKRGNVLHAYLVAVASRVNHMNETEEKSCELYKSTTMTGDKPAENEKSLSEASRERLVILEKDYQEFMASLTYTGTMSKYVDGILKSLRSCIEHLAAWKKQLANETPTLPK